MYGSDSHVVIAGVTNRLSLSPILNLSHNLKQCLKVHTRLSPPAILDTIITSLHALYLEPVTMPPINNNPDNGKLSDYLVVLLKPISAEPPAPPRNYHTLQTSQLQNQD